MKIHSSEELVTFVKSGYEICLRFFDEMRVMEARSFFEEKIREGKKMYGVNTGIGALLDKKIDIQKMEEYQNNLVMSHAAGVGNPLPDEVVRGAFLLLINTLLKGCSGVSMGTLKRLIGFYNSGHRPRILEIGSLGASGDLAPLASLVLYFIQNHGLKLKPGEAIFLINGTHFSTSALGFATHESEKLVTMAGLAATMVIKALDGNISSFKPPGRGLKSHNGQRVVEYSLSGFLGEEDVFPKHLQDPYSLRCVSQIHGAVYDTVEFVKKTVDMEIQSISLNPVILPQSGEVYFGGNFHAQPLAFAADFLGIALTGLSALSERRIERMLNPALSDLPAFLSPEPGINSGLMIAQYIAAALVSKNKVLAYPASVGSISVSAGQEDFVSMACTAASKAFSFTPGTEMRVARARDDK